MSEAKFTPGDWSASKIVSGTLTADSDPRSSLLGLDVDGYAVFMNPADAVLAAAAPEMYAALTACFEVMEDLGGCKQERFQAYKALVKASGGAA